MPRARASLQTVQIGFQLVRITVQRWVGFAALRGGSPVNLRSAAGVFGGLAAGAGEHADNHRCCGDDGDRGSRSGPGEMFTERQHADHRARRWGRERHRHERRLQGPD